MLPVTELKNGTTFKDSQGLWEVIEYKHVKMGRGSATIRVKSRNLKTGSIIEKTFTSGQKVDDLDVVKRKAQFLYIDNDNIVFMDPSSYNQFNLPLGIAAGKEKYLQEGETYDVIFAEDQALGVEIAKLVVMEVAETGPGVKGDTVSSVYKDAVLENGVRIRVPLFINNGDKVKIDTRSGEYVERVK